MTTNLVLTVLATLALASTATAEERYVAAAASAQPAGQVWVPGQWIWAGNAYVWQPGAWRAAAPSPSSERPGMVWFEGRWRQGPDGWVWEPGHFEAQPVYASAPPPPAPTETVVYQSAPQTVVYEQAPATVVVGEPYCPPPVVYHERAVCEPTRPHGNVDISIGVAVAGHGGPAPHAHPFIPLPPLPPLRLLDPLFFLHHHH